MVVKAHRNGRVLLSSRVLDLSTKLLRELDEDEMVYCHLSYRGRERSKDNLVISCLDGIETEMRQARGVRVTSKYAPLLAGFAILDQIGSCYADLDKPPHPQAGSAIHRALYYFMGLNAMSAEVKALYALRNGLVHDASLTCKTAAGDWYIFRYQDTLASSIKLAQRPWNGSIADLSDDTLTLVNPRHFTDQISAALVALRKCHVERPDKLKVLISPEDILLKYLFWHPIE